MTKLKHSIRSHGLTGFATKKLAKGTSRGLWTTRLSKKSAKTTSGIYQKVSITKDGVVILRAKVKPKHFTSKQIRRTIDEIERPRAVKA